jgi:hypothetical protein
MANDKSFPVGDTVKLTVEVRVDDVLTSATMACTIELPDDTQSTPTPSEVSTGIYAITYTTTQSGYHQYRIVATGTASGVREGKFYIHSSGLSS